MIEFNGEINNKNKIWIFRNRLLKTLPFCFFVAIILVLIPFLYILKDDYGLFVTVIVAFVAFYVFGTILFILIFLSDKVALKTNFYYTHTLNIKIDEEIIDIDSKDLSKCYYETSEITKIIDYGELYKVKSGLKGFFIQKDLIVKGTIEDFEQLFEDKIERKVHKNGKG